MRDHQLIRDPNLNRDLKTGQGGLNQPDKVIVAQQDPQFEWHD